ncbi:MAG: pseudouridine synthase [Chitinophagales bacterium]|nr:pseudouridine synthase [Chitinophagales bacterium]
MAAFQYFVIYKPYGYLSQFTREHETHKVLGDLYNFPKDVYPVGRLDKDSEGLLLLTNDNKLNHRLLNPDFRHKRTYWVQVEGQITEEAILQLSQGIDIKINKKTYRTLPAAARILAPPSLPDRDPPIRFRKNVPDSWLELTLSEGKNRQVRRMCAKAGFPVLRLVRVRIEKVLLDGMDVGEIKIYDAKKIYENLGIDK